MDNNSVLSLWEEIKEIVKNLEVDVTKNARGVAAAGVRARKGLRTLQAKTRDLVRLTIELDKSEKSEEKQ